MKSSLLSTLILCVGIQTIASADELPGVAAEKNNISTSTDGASLYQSSSPFRLFDPSRLSIQHSYSLSYFSGGGAMGSGSQGLYTSSIGYQIAKPLFLQVDVGILHQPGALFGNNPNGSNAQVLPNLSLRYTPSPKFNLIVNVQTMPALSYGYGPLRSRYGYR